MKIFHEVEGTSDELQETTGRINERTMEDASEAEKELTAGSESVSEADEAAELKPEEAPSVISLSGPVAEEENVSEADAAEEEAVKTEALTGAETDLTAEPETKAAEENDLQEVSDQTDTEA